jgi:hypothetical protein
LVKTTHSARGNGREHSLEGALVGERREGGDPFDEEAAEQAAREHADGAGRSNACRRSTAIRPASEPYWT